MIDGRFPNDPYGAETPVHAGEPVAGDWRARFFGLKGDLEFQQWACCWTKYYNTNACCPFCDANKRRAPLFTDVRPDAAWITTERTHQNIVAANEPMNNHPLTQIHGWNHRRVLFDLMHVVHLGLLKTLLGGVLVLLCSHTLFFGGGDLAANLAAAFTDWRRWCRRNGITTSVRKFTPGRLNRKAATNWPNLSVKASNGKRILWWLQGETANASIGGEQIVVAAAACLHELVAFLGILDAEDLVLGVAAATRAQTHGHQFLSTFNHLCKLSQQQRRYLFHPIPKVHYLHHVIVDLTRSRLNPRHVANFMDEDFMGKVVKISRRCHRSTLSSTTLKRRPIITLLKEISQAVIGAEICGMRWAPCGGRARADPRESWWLSMQQAVDAASGLAPPANMHAKLALKTPTPTEHV
jgi:hypothetical protein